MNRPLPDLIIKDLRGHLEKFRDDPCARLYNFTLTYSPQGLRDVKSIAGNGFYLAPRRFFIKTARRTRAHMFGLIASEKPGAVSWRTLEPVRPHHHILGLMVWDHPDQAVDWPLVGTGEKNQVRHSLDGFWKYGSAKNGLCVQEWDWKKTLLLYNYGENQLDYHDHEHLVDEEPLIISPDRACRKARYNEPCKSCGAIHSYNPT
jgi:hypothetical protein